MNVVGQAGPLALGRRALAISRWSPCAKCCMSTTTRTTATKTTTTRYQRPTRLTRSRKLSDRFDLNRLGGASTVSLAAFPFSSLSFTPTDIITPLSTWFLAHPLPTYAASIVIITLAVRTLITLPITLWSRSKMARMRDIAGPEFKRRQVIMAKQMAQEYRAKGLSHQQYVWGVQKESRGLRKAVFKEYGVRPLWTLILPTVIHMPIFITMGFVFRDAARLATEFKYAQAVSGTSEPNTLLGQEHQHVVAEQSSLAAGTTSPLDETLTHLLPAVPSSLPTDLLPLSTHLAEFLAEQPLHLVSLVDTDATMILPILIGMVQFGNAEVMQARKEVIETTNDNDNGQATSSIDAARSSNDAPKPRSVTPNPHRSVPRKRGGQQSDNKADGMESVPIKGQAKTPAQVEKDKKVTSLSSRVVAFVFRSLAILSLVFSSQLPAVSRHCLVQENEAVLTIIALGRLYLLGNIVNVYLGSKLHPQPPREQRQASV